MYGLASLRKRHAGCRHKVHRVRLLISNHRTGVFVWRWARDPGASLMEPLSQGVVPLFTNNNVPVPWTQMLEMRDVGCIRWSPCGRWLVAAHGGDSGLCVWETASWKKTLLKGGSLGRGGGSLDIAFHPEGNWFVQVLRYILILDD